MKNNSLKVFSAAALATAGLAVMTMPSSAVTVHTTYYACSTANGLSKVSILAHACPKGAKAVSGSFAGANFSDVTLTGANLSGAALEKTNLSGVVSGKIIGTPAALPKSWHFLSGYLIGPSANLAGANFSNANFSGYNLMGVSLYDANLSSANLSNAILVNASLSNANITSTNFTGANLKGVISAYEVGTPASLPTNWQLVDGNYEGTTVAYLIGPGASIGGAQLKGSVFTGLNLDNIYMAQANLVGTSFAGASMTNAVVASSNLENDDFSNGNFTGTNFSNADFEGANFTNANFTNDNFSGARFLSVEGLNTANFTGAICPDGVAFSQLGENCNM
jgi:uncharacterized protein YjbI with pentapeptide repeats